MFEFWALVCDQYLRRGFGHCCLSILAGAAGIYETTHGLASVDQQAFEGWLNKLRHKLGDADLAALRLRIGALTLMLHARVCYGNLGCPCSRLPRRLHRLHWLSSLPVPFQGQEQMRRKLEKDSTSCVVTRETLPALCFLQSIHQQAADKFFEWSGGASSGPRRGTVVGGQKARRGKSSSGGPAPDEWDMELAGAALRVQQTLETRAHAFAMVSACHLHSWVVYTKKFMAYMLANPLTCFGPHSTRSRGGRPPCPRRGVPVVLFGTHAR